ncbi:NUDIX hydrolase [Patescibacteria group bacterium]|nr:NUDIX hydrolase [Patescibacteria group bacterium]
MKTFYAVKALIVKDNKYLVVQTKDFIGGKYEVPGGRKKEGETDETALKREVLEEVSLQIDIARLLNNWELQIAEKDIHLIGKTYLCIAKDGEPKLSEEQLTFKWVLGEELETLDAPIWLKEAIKQL